MGRRRVRRTLPRVLVALAASLWVTHALAAGLSTALPPQSLADALDVFSRATGFQVIYRTDLAAGVSTRGADAGLSAVDTLRQLLKGTGLGFEFINDRTIAIVKFPASDASHPTPPGKSVQPAERPAPTSDAGASNSAATDSSRGDKDVRHRGFWSRVAGFFTLCGSLAAAGGACAQDEAGVANGPELQEVVVTGIRASLNQTINIKRNETAVVDAISAEDVGKFPDTNLAESLQHITGVEITRDGNGEGQYVTVRGLPTDFTLATLNGLATTTVNPGVRTFDFNLLSPDFVSTLKVYKTSRADLDEGGIAANVDVETVTPLGIGKQRALLSAKLQGSPGQTHTHNDPDITGLYSNVFADDTFGVTVGFDWNKRSFLNQSSDDSPFYGVTLNGKGPYYAYSETGYSNSPSTADSKTGYASLQWKALDSTTATLTGLYSHRVDSYITSDFGVVPLEPFNAPSYTGPGADYTVDGNGVLTRLSVPIVAYTFYNTYSEDRSSMQSLRLNFKTDVGQWNFSETAQYSKSSDNLAWMRPLLIDSTVGGQTPNPGVATFGGYQIYPGAPIQGYIIDPNFNVSDPSAWANQQFKSVAQTGSDTLKSLQADITRHFDHGPIESIQFGAKAYERPRPFDYSYWVYAFPPGSTQYPFAPAMQSPPWVHNVLNTYSGPGVRPSDLYYINPNLWISQNFGSLNNFRSNLQTKIVSSPANNWELTERGRDAYAMANFKFDSPIPISGNMGVRYVKTTEDFSYQAYNIADLKFPNCVIGTAGCEGVIFPPLTPTRQQGSSREFLPSLNVSAQATENMNVRLAASKTISLPTINSMVPVPTINVDGFQVTKGNANLKPFSSVNYDLSWEWYFRRSSMLSLAAYDKQIHGFIQEGADTQNIGGYTFHVNYPVNGSDGYVRGLEANYKQVLDFLPSFWSGLGFELNGTYSRGQQDAAPQYNVIATPFPGLSKFTYNATLFYEKYGFSGIVTVNHRGEYVSDQNLWGWNTTELIGASRTQADMQAQYEFNDHLVVFVDVKNAFDKPFIYTQQLRNGPNTQYPGSWLDNGRRVGLGLTLKY